MSRFFGQGAKESLPAETPAAERGAGLGLFPKEPPELTKARFEALNPESIYEYLLRGGDLSAVVDERRRARPDHIAHWNPRSSAHIASEADDEEMTARVGEHNRIIDDFRRDLLLQGHITEIWEEEMSRAPSGVRGLHRNVYDEVRDYDVKTGYEQPSEMELDNALLAKLSNEKLINRSLFLPREPEYSHLRGWERDLAARPVTAHFHGAKGSKFDVETPAERRHPHVADRLGHPEIFPRPVDSLVGLENMHCHPAFLDLPFVRPPPAEPDAALDFAPGEVVYYKPDNLDWGRFWLFNYAAAVLMGAVIHPLHAVAKTGSTFAFVSEEMPMPFYAHNINGMDYFGLMPPLAAGVVLVAGFLGAKLLNNITQCYVSKLQLNRNRDLLFAASVDFWGKKTEQVYEVEHLELVPPSTRTATKFLDNSARGMTTLTCMNSGALFLLHNDPKYWNPAERPGFLASVKRLWDKTYYEYRPY